MYSKLPSKSVCYFWNFQHDKILEFAQKIEMKQMHKIWSKRRATERTKLTLKLTHINCMFKQQYVLWFLVEHDFFLFYLWTQIQAYLKNANIFPSLGFYFLASCYFYPNTRWSRRSRFTQKFLITHLTKHLNLGGGGASGGGGD